MDFHELAKYKPHIPFKVVERDLAKDEDMRKKLFFSPEDAQIDHSNLRLAKGEVEIPVFGETIMRPLGMKTKYLGYQVEPFGAGFYKITQKIGKIRPKPNDHRYPIEEVKKNVVYIAYNRESQAYQFFQAEKKFKEAYAQIEQLKESREIQDIVNDFIAWIQWFWTPAFKKEFRLERETTLLDYSKLIEHVKSQLPLIRAYSLLLNLWGDICETTYLLTLKSLEGLETHLEATERELLKTPNMLQLINNSPYQEMRVELNLHIQQCLVDRGYFVENGHAYPNLSEQFRKEQFSEAFESDEIYQTQVQKLLAKCTGSYFAYTPPIK